MVVYKARLKAWAAFQIAAEPPRTRSRLHGKIVGLELNPRPETGEVLPGYKNRWRIRVGAYRLVYSIDDVSKTVTIVAIGHRPRRARR